MRRHLALLILFATAVAACSEDGSVETEGSSYFVEAGAITSAYESAAGGHFDLYLAALEEATEETGDAIYVDANQKLFSGLALDFGAAIEAINGLDPPEAVADPHADWVATGAALNDIFQRTNSGLSGLRDAGDVDAFVRDLPLRDLQTDYRNACEAVAALARQADGPTAEIVCQPPEDDGA